MASTRVEAMLERGESMSALDGLLAEVRAGGGGQLLFVGGALGG